MPRPKVDLVSKIKEILNHSESLPDDAQAPILHYRRTGADIWNSLAYVERAFGQGARYAAVAERHLARLYGMALVNLIENLERFLKELAAACVDQLAYVVADDRFNVFRIQGANLAAHFASQSLGKSLCESATWLDCNEINQRFKGLLADAFQSGNFILFRPQSQVGPGHALTFETMSLIWQLRHAAVHNVGIITESDAIKLRLLAREPVAAPRLLAPTRADLVYLKRFLDEAVDECNTRVSDRLSGLLTTLHCTDATLFRPQERADLVSQCFQRPLQVAGADGNFAQ